MGLDDFGNHAESAVSPHPYFDDVVPFYDNEGARRWLGNVSPEDLSHRRAERSILAVQTGDGTWLYPSWQFDENGGVRQVLQPVLAELSRLDGWVAGVWLVNPHPGLGARSPRRALADGEDPRLIASLASHCFSRTRGLSGSHRVTRRITLAA